MAIPASYPVADPAPGFWKAVGNFDVNDYLKMTGLTAISLPFGYAAGNTPGARIAGPSMYVAGMIGLFGGFCLAYQSSTGRLMGLIPNEKEASVKR
ncbi:hypothetical protein KFL_000370240 [Klebsormidium nitens]|uniref:NADH-ubiquinone oxidoreductase 21kDa subunit N-terminal domain-containing protein n=1 Tax=Klebsormidium nitens TaxID=105231 RepID=A0A1Y1HMB7_KLENI|nr:hypothetical protein KFL_000370240 [Klebsormidium nitens]|eukprot:GAQ79750.1 hypothetical protein KFL_000370240 [Klebsormidium nitens]